jgi:hypothetical protein
MKGLCTQRYVTSLSAFACNTSRAPLDLWWYMRLQEHIPYTYPIGQVLWDRPIARLVRISPPRRYIRAPWSEDAAERVSFGLRYDGRITWDSSPDSTRDLLTRGCMHVRQRHRC